MTSRPVLGFRHVHLLHDNDRCNLKQPFSLKPTSLWLSHQSVHQKSTMMHFRNGFRDENCVFQTAENASKGCIMFISLLVFELNAFEISCDTHCISNSPHMLSMYRLLTDDNFTSTINYKPNHDVFIFKIMIKMNDI
jgi:hypothetical protein